MKKASTPNHAAQISGERAISVGSFRPPDPDELDDVPPDLGPPDVFRIRYDPTFADTVVRKVLTRSAVPVGPQTDEARAAIKEQLTDVRHELGNLVNALARTGASSHVTTAIKQREARQAHLERELAALEHQDHVSQIDLQSIEKLARQKVEDWRIVMQTRTPQTRQVLSKMLRGRLVFVPEKRHGKMGYRFEGEGTILRLLSGTVPELEAAGSCGVPDARQLEPDRGVAEAARQSAGGGVGRNQADSSSRARIARLNAPLRGGPLRRQCDPSIEVVLSTGLACICRDAAQNDPGGPRDRSGPSGQAAQLVGPTLHHNDLPGRDPVLVVILDHQEAAAVGRHVVVGRGRSGSPARGAHPVRVVPLPQLPRTPRQDR